jgi:multiple sugar transport system permease protein
MSWNVLRLPWAKSKAAERRARGRQARREELEFYLFISPWIVGFLFLTAGPMLLSLVVSFTEWDIVTPAKWVGLENYKRLWRDLWQPSRLVLFQQSLKVTTLYALLEVPLRLIVNLFGAILLNQKLRGIRLFRTMLYSPTVVPAVASAMVWVWIMLPHGGLLSLILNRFGLPDQRLLFDQRTALITLIFMGLWGFGTGMLIFLAGLQSIPQHLYEAAEIDGASAWARFRHITLPMLSPVIFFNLVTSVMGNFQAFDPAFLITEGGPNYATYFYVLNLYNFGFRYFKMGLATAMAWVLFFIIMAFTLLIVRSSAAWVYYEGEVRGR